MQRRNRGAVIGNEVAVAQAAHSLELIEMLSSPNPCARSVAAIAIGKRKDLLFAKNLCDALSIEKSLYTKIYICEALVNIGIAALPIMIPYIGKIGTNQHTIVPSQTFKKLSYPLPRDIVIRTIVRMGKETLPLLRSTLLTASGEIVREVVDAIGHISFYSKDTESLPLLIDIVRRFPKDCVIEWKVIRALQAFPQKESIDMLNHCVTKSTNDAIRDEARRSLKILGVKN